VDPDTFAFNQRDVVARYLGESHLQKPEEKVLSEFAGHLGTFEMLDLGVGAGRTTLHFAKWVRDYEGVDVSVNMISACQARFASYPLNLTFKVGDAANLDWIKSASKDFVLFSYNGIDYVNHETRKVIISEISRVLKPGGFFLFSSHNLLAVDKLFLLTKQWSRNPVRLFRQMKKCLLLNTKYNERSKLRSLKYQPFAIINDGSYAYALSTYYVSPTYQFDQLKSCFDDIRALSIMTGLDISGELSSCNDDWIYYLCRRRVE
jgi:ubiquinone/menaquinone biosynthesis C-methylase UbiE